MIKGQVAMLHRQTVCYIIGKDLGKDEPGYGERCMVQDFEVGDLHQLVVARCVLVCNDLMNA